MKSAATIMFVCCCLCCCFGGSSAWAIDCRSAPGDPRTDWYSWREIDGRKCWFAKTGAMPPKSQLHWPAKVEEEARPIEPGSPPSKQRTEPEAEAPPQADTANTPEPRPPAPPRLLTARVRPATGASLPLGNGLDLMNGASLSAMRPLGGARRKPATLAPADPFSARFTGSSD